MRNKVLLVSDHHDDYVTIRQTVEPIADLIWANSVAQGSDILTIDPVDFVIVDMALPDGNGVEFCSHLQTKTDAPIFLLTDHTDLAEKVLGFSAGADDIIVKPFSMLELRARMESRLRKLNSHREHQAALKWKNIEIYPNSQEVKVIENGRASLVDLTALEFKLLSYLASKPGDVFSRDDILAKVWGNNLHVYPRSVDTHISKLRKKLGEASDTIRSVHGTGYRFAPDVG